MFRNPRLGEVGAAHWGPSTWEAEAAGSWAQRLHKALSQTTNTKSQPQTVGIQKLDGSAEPGKAAQRVQTKRILGLQFIEHLYVWVPSRILTPWGFCSPVGKKEGALLPHFSRVPRDSLFSHERGFHKHQPREREWLVIVPFSGSLLVHLPKALASCPVPRGTSYYPVERYLR